MSTLKEDIMNRLSNAQEALARAKRKEKKELSEGRRYVKVAPRTYILVYCDENGVPTEKGRRQIEKYQHLC